MSEVSEFLDEFSYMCGIPDQELCQDLYDFRNREIELARRRKIREKKELDKSIQL